MMKPHTLAVITAIAIFAVAMPIHLAAQDRQQLRYSVIDLGTLGGTSSVAYSVNHRGWVAGAASLPGNTAQHAVLWRKGRKMDLGTLGGPNSTAFFPLNDRGEVSGFSDTPSPDPYGEDFCGFGTHLVCLPFVWQNGVRTPLATLGGNNAIANEVNNRGQVGGVAETTTPDPTCVAPQVLQAEPVVWEKGKIEELPTFPGDPDGFVNAINDIGQAVGASGQCYTAAPGIHALLWQNGSATDLGNLGGTRTHFPQDINNQGQVVGFSNLPNDTATHAFLWTEDEGIQDLGTLPGDFWSFAFGISGKGQVVGQSCNMDFSVCRAFLWKEGLMMDLNSVIPAASPLSLLVAFNINSREEIVGQALLSTGEVHAFLATPCDKEQTDNEGCEIGAEGTTAIRGPTNEHPQLAVPENVRKLLRQRLGHWSRIPGL
jgi:probable HAF family extracellular repeat protein